MPSSLIADTKLLDADVGFHDIEYMWSGWGMGSRMVSVHTCVCLNVSLLANCYWYSHGIVERKGWWCRCWW
jgi:hypothetical protein